MPVSVVAKSIEKVRADALVVLHDAGGFLAGDLPAAISRHAMAFAKSLESRESRAEWFCTLEADAGVATRYLLLHSVTLTGPYPGAERLRAAAAHAVAVCRRYSLVNVAFVIGGAEPAALAAAVIEGAMLGDFSDTRFKGSPGERAPLALTLVASKENTAAVRAAAERAEAIVTSTNRARQWVHAPLNILTPEALANEARAIARRHKLKCEVLDERRLRRAGYELLWSVGRGSEHPPRMIKVSYEPKRRAIREHVVLLGKGMTFDTGGYSLKPGSSIYRMSQDMGGAAAALGALDAIAALRLPIRVTAIVPSAHNAVDGAAYHPGEIIRTIAGKTVFIENTDAEGRLILADGLAHAGKAKADVIVDFATLTGAAMRALGPAMAALFTEDESICTGLLAAGAATGDNLWHLPLWREYEPTLEHALADLSNMSNLGPEGGALHAANFLKAFVPDGVRWAHVDMAATVAGDRPFRYFGRGARGFGVRLATEWLARAAERGSL